LWGIFALYQLVRRVWDEEHAIASAAVMALLPGSIFVERSFIPDPAMVSLVVTSFWLLVAYFQTDRLRYLFLASAIATWGFLTKIPGLIVGIPMLYAMFTILGRKRMLYPKKLATIGVAAVFTLVPVIAYYLWARHLSLTYPPYHFAGEGNWLWDDGLKKWLEQKYFLPALYWNFNEWIWTQPLILLVFVGLFLRPPQSDQESQPEQKLGDSSGKAPWLFHWWMLAAVIYYLIGAKELVINSWNFHILNPAAAALAGHAMIAIASFANKIARSPASLATVVAILLIVSGFGQKHLWNMYNPPWDSTVTYKLGLALRQVSAPDDLVVTIPHGTTEPIAIYYSQRRGWSFPPPWPGVGWWGGTIKDDSEAIRLFEELRNQSADWLGIVASRKKKIWENNPKFVKYIEGTCELKSESPEWVIYRILTPEEVSKLPNKR
jgi:4-amino-4-deoxy-L-arabinose transferase-like glycosyltransferase